MDEEYLSWLGLIPGVARRRAMALAERFPSVEALRAASVEDIASVEGIGPVLARRIKDFAGASREEADFSRSNEAFLYLCPACGALIAKHATVCPICRAELEGGEMPEPAPAPEAEVLQALRQALNLCPSCGAFVGEGAAPCPLCGATLEGEDAAVPAVAEEAAPLPPEAISSEPSLYLCTMCGAFLLPQDRKCPA
ncbi:MAG: zinc ribbon domain-containing protein, partial [Euryarchaeota archaeon]|nr:zinc ribbon domain-containing protein [Euryarchaeota archaeon]